MDRFHHPFHLGPTFTRLNYPKSLFKDLEKFHHTPCNSPPLTVRHGRGFIIPVWMILTETILPHVSLVYFTRRPNIFIIATVGVYVDIHLVHYIIWKLRKTFWGTTKKIRIRFLLCGYFHCYDVTQVDLICSWYALSVNSVRDKCFWATQSGYIGRSLKWVVFKNNITTCIFYKQQFYKQRQAKIG